jgi:hypothetical protein
MGAGKFGPPGWQDDRQLEGMVGPQPAVSHTDLRAHPPAAAADRDGGRHHLPLPRTPRGGRGPRRSRGRQPMVDQDVRIGGGPTVARDFIAAGLVDHVHLVQVPIVLGRGVRLWDGLEASRGGLPTSRRSRHPAASPTSPSPGRPLPRRQSGTGIAPTPSRRARCHMPLMMWPILPMRDRTGRCKVMPGKAQAISAVRTSCRAFRRAQQGRRGRRARTRP